MQSRWWLHVRDGSSRQRAGSAVAPRLLLCPLPPPLLAPLVISSGRPTTSSSLHHLLQWPLAPLHFFASTVHLLLHWCISRGGGARDPAADSTAHPRCGRGFHRASEIRLWTPPRARDPVVDSIVTGLGVGLDEDGRKSWRGDCNGDDRRAHPGGHTGFDGKRQKNARK
jgi:hypothetical protein